MLASHFLYKFCKLHKKEMNFTDEAFGILLEYKWPGNIRELENTMERIVLLNDNGEIDRDMVASSLPGSICQREVRLPCPTKDGLITKTELDELEKSNRLQALKECGRIQAKAARKLGITVRQIGYKILKHGIEI